MRLAVLLKAAHDEKTSRKMFKEAKTASYTINHDLSHGLADKAILFCEVHTRDTDHRQEGFNMGSTSTTA